jgi:hypothetical protein
MSNKYGYTESLNAGRELQRKFDYFFLGVIVATLSIGIQTKFSVCDPNRWFLFSSWGLWALSFLSGFFRQERTVQVLSLETTEMIYKPSQELYKKAQEGQVKMVKDNKIPWTNDELKAEIRKLDELVQFLNVKKSKHIKAALIAYHVTKWTYFIGVALYIFYRAVNVYGAA